MGSCRKLKLWLSLKGTVNYSTIVDSLSVTDRVFMQFLFEGLSRML